MLIRNGRPLSASIRRLVYGTAIAACAMSATATFAQNAPATQASNATQNAASLSASNDLDEIVVTGTSIRGVAPIGTELISVTRQDIIATSASTTFDVLRKIPALAGFGATPQVTADPMTSINLPSIHGLAGAGEVLVLFDGLRAVGSGIIANSPDPSSIPAAALERVEVLPDGASSIYGSDAVSGVINLITRRDLNGVEISAHGGIARPYNQSDASLAWGHTWDGGNAMMVYEFTDNSKLSGKDRTGIYGLNQTGRYQDDGLQGTDWRDTGCDPGTIYVGPKNTAYPLPLNAPGAPNKCDYVGNNTLIPQDHRNDFFLSAHQQLAPNLELWGQGFLALHTAEKDTIQGDAIGFTLPNTNPYFQLPAAYTAAGGYTGPPITSVLFDYSPQKIIGSPLHDDLSLKTVQWRGGLNWKIGESWEGKFIGNFGHEDDFFTGQFTNFANYSAALNGTTIATALNPFGPSAQTVVNSLQDYLLNAYHTIQNLDEGQVSFDGSLFHWQGGDTKLAVGGAWRKETYKGTATSGSRDLGTPNLDDFAIDDRNVKSEYAELYVPIVGAQNEMLLVHRLDVSLSVRHDDYSDFGATTNPKYGINWSPLNGLVLRGNYSTSFHAPNLADDTVPSIDSHAQAFCCIFPPPTSPPGSPGLYTIILNGGSKNLKPETSENFSFGLDETPPEVPGLKFSATYFHVAFRDQIGYLPPQYLYSGGAASKFYTVDPTLAQEEAFIAGYPLEVSSINGGKLPGLLLDLRRVNIGAVNYGGVDFNLGYTRPLGGGDLAFGLNGTRMTEYETQGVEGSGSFLSQLGTGEGLSVHPIKWQARANLGWTNHVIDADIYFNYVGSYLYYANNVYGHVRSYTPVDLHFGVSPFTGMFKTTQLTFDVNNVFDQSPPYVDEGVAGDNAQNGYDKQAASPLGRLLVVGFRSTF
jgi:iron complex outermembrane receptor protein